MKPCQVISLAGVVTAVTSGLGTVAVAQVDPPPSQNASVAGLLIAIAGLATAVGAQLQPMFRIWIEEKREERRAKFERHDLANRLQNATLEIALLRQVVAAHDSKISRNEKVADAMLDSGLIRAPRLEDPSSPPPNPTGPSSSS